MATHLTLVLALLAGANALPNLLPRQGVTVAISPSAPAPSGCSAGYSGSFGIAVMSLSAKAVAATQIADGQAQAGTKTVPISQITDGQAQAPKTTAAPVNQISDGQAQAPKVTAAPVGQIADGQIQASTKPRMMGMISMIADGQIQAPVTRVTVRPISQIKDGQVQAPTASAVKQITDGQVQAPKASAVSQITDGQAQAPKASAVSQISDGQAQASGSSSSGSGAGLQPVACASSNTLALTLKNGVLKDAKGRTGYIADNYQFQFDDPPQTGSLFTSGFSVCGNGSLALGGSAVFYQCLSGDFYNLYDRSWAPQCSPIAISAVTLQQC